MTNVQTKDNIRKLKYPYFTVSQAKESIRNLKKQQLFPDAEISKNIPQQLVVRNLTCNKSKLI